MECDNCHKLYENGHFYTFHYGKTQKTKSFLSGYTPGNIIFPGSTKHTKITDYQILGEKSIRVCNFCYLKNILKYLIYWPIVPIIYWIIVFRANLPSNIIIGVIWVILAIIMPLWTFIGVGVLVGIFDQEEMMMDIFKRINADFLKSQGADKVFTQKEYSKLRPKSTDSDFPQDPIILGGIR
jgi:hypothetical protein